MYLSGSFSAARSDGGSQRQATSTTTKVERATNARRSSRVKRLKTFQKMKRARRENRAILMSFLVSLSYLLCYMEIINFYITAILDISLPSVPGLLISLFMGSEPSAMALEKKTTYLSLWYYYSLFVAATSNVFLHLLFNHIIRRGLGEIRDGVVGRRAVNGAGPRGVIPRGHACANSVAM